MTDKQKRDTIILEMRADGRSLREIADTVGWSVGCVYHVLNRNKQTAISKTLAARIERDTDILNLRQQGYTYHQIANLTGVTWMTVGNICRAADMGGRRPKPVNPKPLNLAQETAMAEQAVDEVNRLLAAKERKPGFIRRLWQAIF